MKTYTQNFKENMLAIDQKLCKTYLPDEVVDVYLLGLTKLTRFIKFKSNTFVLIQSPKVKLQYFNILKELANKNKLAIKTIKEFKYNNKNITIFKYAE